MILVFYLIKKFSCYISIAFPTIGSLIKNVQQLVKIKWFIRRSSGIFLQNFLLQIFMVECFGSKESIVLTIHFQYNDYNRSKLINLNYFLFFHKGFNLIRYQFLSIINVDLIVLFLNYHNLNLMIQIILKKQKTNAFIHT